MPSTAHIGYRPTGHRRARRRGGLATSGCHPSRAIVPPQWNRDSCKAETYGSYTWGDMKKADRYSTHVSTHTPDIPGDAASRRDRHRSAAVPQRRGQLEAMAATGGGERVCTRSITYGTGDVAAANGSATADRRQRWCRWRRGGGGRGRRAGRGAASATPPSPPAMSASGDASAPQRHRWCGMRQILLGDNHGET